MAFITVAQSAGFCFGVKRAVDIVYQAIEEGKKVYTLGPIIHNAQVVEELAQKGVQILMNPEDIKPGDTVIIRSHGVEREVYEKLQSTGAEIIDTTCPYVAKIHRIVSKEYDEDTGILIAGDPNHPEVKGILGHCRYPAGVFQNKDEMLQMLSNSKFSVKKHLVFVAQTTFNMIEWEKSVNSAKKEYTNLLIFDTICNATSERQREAAKLAERSGMMVVVGDRHSSNTAKLREICSQYCPTLLVEAASELNRAILPKGFPFGKPIGVTAGASTPARIIKEVQETMSELMMNNQEENFEELLNQSTITTYNGAIVKGTVLGVSPTELQVDIGTKYAGYVPLQELTDDPTVKVEDAYKPGDVLDLLVVRINDVDGTTMLSKKRLDAAAGIRKVMEAKDTGETLKGIVVEVVNKGILALTNGVRVFIPASHVALSRVEDLSVMLKQTVEFKIIETNPERKRAVGSIKAVLREQRKAQEEQFWNDIEVGKRYTGVVKSIVSYGAFVDLGGVDGMVHISELSWNRIRHPSEVVKVGDTIEVYVKDLDPEARKISLGYKKTEDNPWEILKNNYSVGSVAKVKIVSMTTFGAFAQILPGVDGLIHISQISTQRIAKPQDVLNIGDEVDVKITELDFDKKRISLSIRALAEEAAASQTEESAEE
jgi:4-hydroxy-3-methylbut-2-enyl diphosphate reductase